MRGPLHISLLCAALTLQSFGTPPRKGVSYKPTQDGGRACYIDGTFAYLMPQVPKGYWGATYGVYSTPGLADGPLKDKDWSAYLASKGMAFPRGASATFYADFGHLVVVNTREQHAVLMKIAGVQPPE